MLKYKNRSKNMKKKNKQKSTKLLLYKRIMNNKAKDNVEIKAIKKPIKP